MASNFGLVNKGDQVNLLLAIVKSLVLLLGTYIQIVNKQDTLLEELTVS